MVSSWTRGQSTQTLPLIQGPEVSTVNLGRFPLAYAIPAHAEINDVKNSNSANKRDKVLTIRWRGVKHTK